MSRRARLKSKGYLKFSARGAALLAAAGILTTWATLNATANVFRSRAPETALALPFGGDPTAAAAAVDNLTRSQPEAFARPEVSARLRAALRHDPLDAAAIRGLGFAAEARRDPGAAKKAIDLAARVSRRDAATQLWLIERASRDGDVARTLRHYDIALKTNVDVQPLLFGTLANALAEPEVARALVALIRPKPSWLYAFVAQTVESKTNLAQLQRVIAQAGGLPDTAEFQALETRFVQRLVELGEFDAARRLYTAADPSSRATGRVAGFTRRTTDERFAPYTWQTFGNASTGVAFEVDDGGDDLAARIIANSNAQTTVLRRVFELTPGSYRFSVRTEISAATRARVRWSLRCNGEKEASQTWQAATARIEILPGCRNQLVELDVWGEDDADGVEIVLRDLGITTLAVKH